MYRRIEVISYTHSRVSGDQKGKWVPLNDLEQTNITVWYNCLSSIATLKIHKTLTKLFEIWLSSWYLLHDINYFAFQQRYNNDASLERKIHHLIKFRPPFHNNTHYYIFLFVQFFHIPFRLDANNANEC